MNFVDSKGDRQYGTFFLSTEHTSGLYVEMGASVGPVSQTDATPQREHMPHGRSSKTGTKNSGF